MSISAFPAAVEAMRASLRQLAAIVAALTAIPAVAAHAQPAPGAEAPPPAQTTEPSLPVVVPPGQATVAVEIALNTLAPGRPVPAGFLGLSFEAQALAQLAPLGEHGDLVRLLHQLGTGLLRFGGITADENVAWTDAQTPRPEWATNTIGPAQMQQLGVLARRSGWGVLLTVGIAHFEPQAAAREVAAAHAALGRALIAVEIGNEPDAYGRHGFRTAPWGAQTYEEQVAVYREAIERLTPGVRIAGPDVSGSGAFAEWGNAEALSQAPALLTGHHYPLGCAQTPPPSIETLLSAEGRGLAARSLETYLSVARAHGIPFRMDETGSVSCGGVAGISDTYAAALWGAAYIGQTMAAGSVGVNLQGNPLNCAGYTPLCAADPAALAAGQLQAEPPWYALLLTRSLVGYRPLPTTIVTAGTTNLAAYGFAGPGRTRKLLLVDGDAPGASALALRVPLGPGLGAARVLRLTGPSLEATGGLRLGGRAVAADGSWRGPTPGESAPVHGGVLSMKLGPASAALVTVAPAPKKTHRRHRRRPARHGQLRGRTARPAGGR
jgi:hypothetical protein